MPLVDFDLEKDDTRLVKCDNMVYKVKVIPQVSLTMSCSRESGHAQIEDVLRAVLYIDQRSVILKPIHTADFVVTVRKKIWRTGESLKFYLHEKPIKACPYQFILKVNSKYRPVSTSDYLTNDIQKVVGSQNKSNESHGRSCEKLHDKDANNRTISGDEEMNATKKSPGSQSKKRRKSNNSDIDPKQIVDVYKTTHISKEVELDKSTSNDKEVEAIEHQRLREKIRKREQQKLAEIERKKEVEQLFMKPSDGPSPCKKARKLYTAEVYCKTPGSGSFMSGSRKSTLRTRGKVSLVKDRSEKQENGEKKSVNKVVKSHGKDSEKQVQTKGCLNKVNNEHDEGNETESLKCSPRKNHDGNRQSESKGFQSEIRVLRSRQRDFSKEENLEKNEQLIEEDDIDTESNTSSVDGNYSKDAKSPKIQNQSRKGQLLSKNSIKRRNNSSLQKSKTMSASKKGTSLRMRGTSKNSSVSTQSSVYSLRKNKFQRSSVDSKSSTSSVLGNRRQRTRSLRSGSSASKSGVSTRGQGIGKQMKNKLDSNVDSKQTSRTQGRTDSTKLLPENLSTARESERVHSIAKSNESKLSSAQEVTRLGRLRRKAADNETISQNSSSRASSASGILKKSVDRKDTKKLTRSQSYSPQKRVKNSKSPKIDLFRPLGSSGHESERLDKLRNSNYSQRKKITRNQLDRHVVESEEIEESMKLQTFSKSETPPMSPSRKSPRLRKKSGFWDFVDSFITPVKNVFKS